MYPYSLCCFPTHIVSSTLCFPLTMSLAVLCYRTPLYNQKCNVIFQALFKPSFAQIGTQCVEPVFTLAVFTLARARRPPRSIRDTGDK
ncbi:hypothetical protein FB45DRAFT_557831 [Roridomyces roridus]|uniref:Uncharacterized protein n=1 Tax=Roridomyces roridus TaxID=1738132 RepID=A0AAD7BV40_9AGAR|nr:hypothetical protein FB45DRAFT_557831 [Roridomyces roridus]